MSRDVREPGPEQEPPQVEPVAGVSLAQIQAALAGNTLGAGGLPASWYVALDALGEGKTPSEAARAAGMGHEQLLGVLFANAQFRAELERRRQALQMLVHTAALGAMYRRLADGAGEMESKELSDFARAVKVKETGGAVVRKIRMDVE